MKEFDIYGDHIGLTYKGETSFKTFPGAIVSLIVVLLICAFSLYRTIIFFEKNDPNVSKQGFMRNLDSEDPINPKDYGFDFAFGLDTDL